MRYINPVFSCVLLVAIFTQPVSAQDDEKSKNAIQQQRAKKIRSYAELLQAYESQKVKFDKNEKAKSLIFRATKGDFKGVMVVKWDDVNGVLHLIQTMPLTIPKEKTELYLKAAQTLNHGFLFPGIGMNMSNGGTYYRLSIPIAPRGYLHDYELGTYTRFTINKAAEFLPTLNKVIDGEVEIDELILHHQKYLLSLANSKPAQLQLDQKYSRTVEGIEWLLDFSKPGQVKVFRDGKLGAESTVTIKGNQCVFQDNSGPLASTEPGTYQVVQTGGKLTFRVVEDKSDQRNSVLTGGVWTKK